MQVNLDGQIALVTGASAGIGRAIADVLAKNGARVIYADINAVDGVLPAGSVQLRMDVSDPGEVEAGSTSIIAQFGRLDILVNSAGINTLEHRVNIDQFPLEEWDRILKVDLTGVFVVSRAASAQMIRQGSGKIINVASVAGMVPLRLQSAFVAAKAGVVNLTKSMAIELGGQGILVNCVAPGSTLTEGTRELFYGEDGKFRDSVSSMLAHIPLGRPGTNRGGRACGPLPRRAGEQLR